jgi:hypothetical protein
MDWSEQVQVKRLSPDHIVWDGITLDVAVQRIMDLPPNERAGLTIFAPSGAYSGRQIEALFDILPQSKWPTTRAGKEQMGSTGGKPESRALHQRLPDQKRLALNAKARERWRRDRYKWNGVPS